MSNSSIQTLFQRVRPRQAAAEIDAADLGTCFGLEYSLAPAEAVPHAAAARPSRRQRWMQRLGSLGKSSS